MLPLPTTRRSILPKLESPIPVKIHSHVSLILPALLKPPVRRIGVFSLFHEASKFHPRIADISHSVDIVRWDEVKCMLLQEFDSLLIFVHMTVQKLEHGVEHHLDCDEFTSMCRTV